MINPAAADISIAVPQSISNFPAEEGGVKIKVVETAAGAVDGPAANEIHVKLQDSEFDIVIKPMTWQGKNELVAKCMTFDANGNSTFDSGVYIREVLKGIILSAPWGKTDDQFLDSINGELGNALEKLVPSAFDSNFAEVDVIKKG